MGWLFYNKPKGESLFDHFAAKYALDDESRCRKLLDLARVGGACYGALEVEEKDAGRKYVTALVILVSSDARHGHNFGYKDMDESMGPCESTCPARILALLSPIEDVFPGADESADYSSARNAREWRQRCRGYLSRALAAKDIKPGALVEFAEPMKFSNGQTLQRFTYRRTGRTGRREHFVADGVHYSITGWRLKDYRLMNTQDALAL